MTSYLEALQNLDKKERKIPGYYKSSFGFDVIDICNMYNLNFNQKMVRAESKRRIYRR